MAGDDEAEEVLAEFDFLVSETDNGGEAQSHADGPEWGESSIYPQYMCMVVWLDTRWWS